MKICKLTFALLLAAACDSPSTAIEQSIGPGDGAGESADCALTQGYWKNHASAWDVTMLSLGNVSYTQDELLAIFRTPVRGNGLISLAHQLIAAKLNVANGADASGVDIAGADALIGDLVVPPIGDGYLAPGSTSGLVGELDD